MSSLTTEKQQELADKILQRAELAQMARKLKLGLSKVSSPKKNASNINLVNKGKRGSISLPDNGNIPGSVGRLRAKSVSKPNHNSESPSKRSKMKPPSKQRTESGTAVTSDETLVSMNTSNKVVIMTASLSQEAAENVGTNPGSAERVSGNSAVIRMPSTPKSKSDSNSNKDINVEGADLLMYLATSPYASSVTRRTSISGTSGSSASAHAMPYTPSSGAYINHNTGPESQLNDIVRLSHMKERASTNSPQSTFKQPVMISSNLSDMMRSPSVAMFTSPRRRGTEDHHLLAPGTPSRIGISASSMSSDQITDSQARIGSLLKTPNFNMGDYVHTLFSPSPRIDTAPPSKE